MTKSLNSGLDPDVAHRDGGQIDSEILPTSPVVERNPKTVLGSRVEQIRVASIGADRAGILIARQSIDGFRPVRAVIVRDVDVGSVVSHAMVIRNRIRRSGNQRRRRDRFEARELRRPGRCNVLPMRPAIARQLHVAVVGSTQISPWSIEEPSM